MCIEAGLSRCLVYEALGPSRTRTSATKMFKAALSGYGSCSSGSGEEQGARRRYGQGCVEASQGPAKLALSYPKPADQCDHLSIEGRLALV
jgi:hypothetical protein